jgi:transcription elongation factor GreA
MDKFPITQNGFNALEEELKNLKSVQRPAVISAIAEAREHGDLSENAEYHAAREQQSFIEGRIQELESVISKAQIINPSDFSGDIIRFGATVQVVDEDTDVEETLTIVGEYETDTDKGKISMNAPVARALIGKSVGDSVEVTTPRGKRTYEVLNVKYI